MDGYDNALQLTLGVSLMYYQSFIASNQSCTLPFHCTFFCSVNKVNLNLNLICTKSKDGCQKSYNYLNYGQGTNYLDFIPKSLHPYFLFYAIEAMFSIQLLHDQTEKVFNLGGLRLSS